MKELIDSLVILSKYTDNIKVKNTCRIAVMVDPNDVSRKDRETLKNLGYFHSYPDHPYGPHFASAPYSTF